LNWKTFQTNRSLASASSRRGRSAGRASPRAVWVALGLALFIAASRPARAEIYRYVDADGVTVYSQSPPPAALASGARSESGPESGSVSESGPKSGTPTTITLDRGPSSAEVAAAQARLKQQLERDLDRREEERRLAQETAQNEARAKQRASACAAARGNLQTLQNLGSKRLRLPDGSSIRPSAEQRVQYMDQARQQIRALCD
jgi:Skp family chaperone for outer membrane proteins